MNALHRAGFRTGIARSVTWRQDASDLRAAHAGIVDARSRLELLPRAERAHDHGFETSVAHELRRSLERAAVVARQRDGDPVSLPMRLGQQGLEVHRIERLHP